MQLVAHMEVVLALTLDFVNMEDKKRKIGKTFIVNNRIDQFVLKLFTSQPAIQRYKIIQISNKRFSYENIKMRKFSSEKFDLFR